MIDAEPGDRPRRAGQWLAIGFILLAVVWAYRGSLRAPWLLDDQAAILDNPHIRALGSSLASLDSGTRHFLRRQRAAGLPRQRGSYRLGASRLGPRQHRSRQGVHTFP